MNEIVWGVFSCIFCLSPSTEGASAEERDLLPVPFITSSEFFFLSMLVSDSEVQSMVHVYNNLAALSPRDKFIDRNTL